jgi:MOSC domain-containing protein YiiM
MIWQEDSVWAPKDGWLVEFDRAGISGVFQYAVFSWVGVLAKQEHRSQDDEPERTRGTMEQKALRVDSNSVGDPARYHTLDHLERSLAALPGAPENRGYVALLVRRGEGGWREKPDWTYLAPEAGLPGDAWGRQKEPQPEAQITVMQIDVAELIANGQPLTLFGDNLFLALDLSAANLPPGSLVRVGGATMEVTPKPHNGCQKFRVRFGPEALRFVSKPDLRHRNLRGIYMRVVERGEVALGDPVEVIARAASRTTEV